MWQAALIALVLAAPPQEGGARAPGAGTTSATGSGTATGTGAVRASAAGSGTTSATGAATPTSLSADSSSARLGRTVIGRAAPRFSALVPPPALTWGSVAVASGVAVRARSSAEPSVGGSPADSPVARNAMGAAPVPADSPGVHRRPRAVQYSDWYARRLALHRVMSYALLPLLAAQYYTGTQLMAKGADAPLWVIRTHAPLATAAAVLFGANTVTGVWNLWDARQDSNGRFARTAHGLLMLAADAGFLAAGSMGHPAVQNGPIRSLHRTIALSSMGVALVSYAIMLPPFRR